jgi:hypothetical protein
LPGADGRFSPELTYVIRQARERRDIALAIRAELNRPIRTFTLRATLASNIEALGGRIREFLDVSEATQQRWGKKAFDEWRTLIEARDVLVFVVPRLKMKEMRGTAIAEANLPIILVNGKDRSNGRVFTLLHEFCHLALRQSGVSNLGSDRDDAPSPIVEQFCNAVAAAALMPSEWLLRERLVVQKEPERTGRTMNWRRWPFVLGSARKPCCVAYSLWAGQLSLCTKASGQLIRNSMMTLRNKKKSLQADLIIT